MVEVWKYVNSKKKVKHLFYSYTQIMSTCGRMPTGFFNTRWKWDKEGLDIRRKCKSCLRSL